MTGIDYFIHELAVSPCFLQLYKHVLNLFQHDTIQSMTLFTAAIQSSVVWFVNECA
jgi:hypothetical protein